MNKLLHIFSLFFLLAGGATATPTSFLDDKIRELENTGRRMDPATVTADHPPLFAQVESDAAGYRFTHFSFKPENGIGWVHLFSGKRMWEAKYQHCLRHPFNGSCEKVDPKAFMKRNAHPVGNVLMAGMSFGIRPLFFGIDTSYTFDAAKWDAALQAAKARYTQEAGHPLQEDLDRLRADWTILMALEQKGRDALRRRTLAVNMSGGTPALLAAGREGLVGTEFRYPWRETLTQQSTKLSELMTQFDTLVQQQARSQPRDWPLQLRCPAARLAAYALADVCDLQTTWQGDTLRVSGNLRIKGFALPSVYPTVLSIPSDRLDVEYRHGVVWLRNKGDKPVLVEKMSLLREGKDVPRWLARKELTPGADGFYAGFTLDLPEAKAPTATALLDPVRLGSTTRYGLRLQLLNRTTYEPEVIEVERESTLEELLANILRTESAYSESLDYEALKRVGRLATSN